MKYKCYCQSKPILKRENIYGHGEQYMILWYQCPNCGARSKSVCDYADYELEKNIRKAFENWKKLSEHLNKSGIKIEVIKE